MKCVASAVAALAVPLIAVAFVTAQDDGWGTIKGRVVWGPKEAKRQALMKSGSRRSSASATQDWLVRTSANAPQADTLADWRTGSIESRKLNSYSDLP